MMNGDGTLSDPHGAPKDRADAHPEIAWGTSDLFREGAPLVPFFKFMLESAGLSWFQSPAAGYDNAEFRMLVDKGVRVTNAHVNSLPIAEFVMRSVLDEFQGAAQWRDCGVRYMVLTNAGPLQRSLRKGLLSVQPFGKIIRGLKKL